LATPYGYFIRVLENGTQQAMNNALASMDLTAAQGHVMGFITHRSEPPCPKDIEEKFQLSHPTVSGILSRLEQKGFIEMRPDTHDRRCKRIYVLEKGWQCHELMHQTIQKNEQRMTEGFSEEEREIFSDLLQRAIRNMGGDPTPRRFKEDKNA
jgi:DNA-binding MarR family transcriptional regulator